ncbi:MAG: hypothetical protein KUL88_11510 [Rhizobium sp.]|nr:hypothetical protein [Rhizobium sp.]
MEDQPHVSVVSGEGLPAIVSADIVLSASSRLRGFIESDFSSEKTACILAGARCLLAAVVAPALFHDFVSGLSEGWFARSQTAEFPIGALATVADWRAILSSIGFGEADVVLRVMTGGPVTTIETRASTSAAAETFNVAGAAQNPVLLVHDGRIALSDLSSAAEGQRFPSVGIFAARGDLAIDKKAFTEYFERHADGPLDVIHLSPAVVPAADASDVQDNVLILSAFALALADYRGSLAKAPAPIRLLVSAPGGAVNSGLWTFLRVLRNEFDFLDVQSIDSGAARRDLTSMLSDVAAICVPGAANRE